MATANKRDARTFLMAGWYARPRARGLTIALRAPKWASRPGVGRGRGRGRGARQAGPALLELLERARPVLLEQPRQRPIGEQLAAGLAHRAVVRLVLGVDDTLHRRPAHRARLAELAVHRHLGPERGDLVGEAVADLGAEPRGPLLEDV